MPVELHVEIITLLPPHIIDNHRNMVIGIDVMFINGVPFLTTVSCMVRFGSATEMSRVTMDNVITALKIINVKYRVRRFKIIAAAADNGYSTLENNPDFLELNITLILTADDEH